MSHAVLVVDSTGTPKDWVNLETAACYYALDKVIWQVGQTMTTFRGGWNKNGIQSSIDISSIIGITGPILGKSFLEKKTAYAERSILYARDRHVCAYCGNTFQFKDLTIDHVLPKSRGGKNTWMNTVASCKPCNSRKADRTPEEAKMHLLYVPYIPNAFEKMILRNRRILADQMEFLMARVPKTSRLHSMPELLENAN